MLYANLHAAAYCKLIGVDLWREQVLCRGKDAVCIFYGKEALVAEDVDEICQGLRCLDFARHDTGGVGYCRQHYVANLLHISFFGHTSRYCVGAKEGAFDGRRNGLFDAADYPQHLEFVLRIKPVAALYFHGYGAFVHHLLHAYHRLAVKLVFRGAVQKV